MFSKCSQTVPKFFPQVFSHYFWVGTYSQETPQWTAFKNSEKKPDKFLQQDEYLDSEGLEKTYFVEANLFLDVLSSTFFVVPIHGRELFVDGPM